MNTIENVRPEIQNHPFLASASPEFVETLAQFDDLASFDAGEVIFKENDYADAFFLILEGTVQLKAERFDPNAAIVLQELGPGDVLGWSWLFPPFTWNFTAQAKTDCKAVRFNAPAVLIRSREDSVFGYELMKRLSAHVIHRLQKTREMLIRERLEKEALAQELRRTARDVCTAD